MQGIKKINEGELGTRPGWDEWYMHIILSMASRSSCHHVRSASVVVSNKQIVGEGYNGAPSRIEKNCIETGCRKENKGLVYHESLNSGECIGVHSEMNALGHLSKIDNKEITLYTTIFPCHTCAKNLLSYNIKKIVFRRYYSEKEIQSTLELLQEAGVEICQLELSPERYIDIAFNFKNKNIKFDVWSPEEKIRIKNLFAKPDININYSFKELKPGKYQHFKGQFYKVIGIAKHSETNEEFVVYQALYDSEEFGNNALWIRPKTMFLENVIHEGKEVPRFNFVGD